MSADCEHLKLDAKVLAAARAGDMVAGESIYRQFERPVYTLAFRICQRREDAQEVLQDTFVKALGSLGQYRGDAPFWPWLKRVAVSQALMLLRRERIRRLWLVPASGEDCTDTDLNLDLNAALAGLPPTARAVVWLHDVEGCSHQEIARAMGKSASFSKSQLARARARLRAQLAPAAEEVLCMTVMKV